MGPTESAQKVKYCGKCSGVVASVYRVYEQKLDKHGTLRVTRGQYEVAHFDEVGKPVWSCTEPRLIDRLMAKVRAEQDEGSESSYGASTHGGTALKSRMVHMKHDGTGTVRVHCGARGSLWTTLDSELVTCSNCKVRLGQQPKGPTYGPNNQPNQQQEEGDKSMSAVAEKVKVTGADIKAKIAAAKANKAAAGAGNGASLVMDEAGVPLPKAAGVKKERVASVKVDSGPKVLNICGCGCGSPCKSSFLPGHDARLHGQIKKLGLGLMSLADIPAQVKDGMYNKVKQTSVKDGEGKVSLSGVQPTTSEADYLALLKGKGGVAA